MGWNDFFETNSSQVNSTLSSLQRPFVTMLNELPNEFKTVPVATAMVGVAVVSFGLGVRVGTIKIPWRRITSVHDIPEKYIGPSSPFLRGRVVSVSDGDTIRFLHVPTWFSSSTLPTNEKISDIALPIRVCTIDTPETSKFGKSGQPFGEEAKEKLKSMIENKIVTLRMLQKDQYSRIVAEIRVGTTPFPFIKRYIDEEMLKAGLAEVYQGSGAVYGRLGTKDAYLAIEEKARTAKIGIWSLRNRESAKDYKARTKEE